MQQLLTSSDGLRDSLNVAEEQYELSKLTTEKEKKISQLAKLLGINDVQKIEVLYLYGTPNILYIVSGQDVIDEDERLTQKILRVASRSLKNSRLKDENTNTVEIDEFYSSPDNIRIIYKCKVEGNNYSAIVKVESDQTCENISNLVLSVKKGVDIIVPEQLLKRYQQFDWQKISSVSFTNGIYEISSMKDSNTGQRMGIKKIDGHYVLEAISDWSS